MARHSARGKLVRGRGKGEGSVSGGAYCPSALLAGPGKEAQKSTTIEAIGENIVIKKKRDLEEPTAPDRPKAGNEGARW